MSNTNKRVFTDESLSTLVDNIKSGDEKTLSSAKEYSDSIKIDLENAVEIISTKLDTIEDGAQVNTVTSVAGKTGEVTLSKTDVGLENVDNTSDAIKKSNFTGQISESNTGFVTGGDAYTQLTNKVDKVIGKGLSTNDLTDSLKSNYDIAYTNNHTHDNKTVLDNISATTVNTWNNKQDALTFDSAPTSGSTNPVTSEGVKTALDNIKECEVININITEDEIVNNTTGRIIRTLSTTDGVIIFDETKECVIIVNAISNILMFHRQQVIIGSDGTANALFIAQDIDAMCLLGVIKEDNEYSVIIDFEERMTYGFSYANLLSMSGETKYEFNSHNSDRYIQFREGANISLTNQGVNQIIISATDTTYEGATTATSGLMSASDKEKLDTIEEGAQVNQNAFSTVNVAGKKLSATSKTDSLAINAGTNVSISADELSKGMIISATDTTYENATTTKSGLMSASDKEKLDTIQYNAVPNAPSFGTALVMDSSTSIKDTIAATGTNHLLVLQEGQNISLTGNSNNKIQIAFSGTLPVANGGTGATTQSDALTNLVNGTGVVNTQSITTSDYIIFQSKGSDVLRLPVSDFKTALGIGEPYIKTLNSAEWIETASSSDTTIAAMADFGKYYYKIAATTHGKGINPIVQMRYVRPFNTVGHFVNISSNSIVDGDGNVYIFSNNTLYDNAHMYSVIIK